MKKKSLFILIAILLIAVASFVYLRSSFKFGKPEFAKVAVGNVDITVTAEGEIISKSAVPVSASFLFKKVGIVNQLKIKSIVPEGKYVKAGEEIAQLDRQSIANAVQAFVSDVSSMRSQAERAVSDTANQLRDARYNLSSLRINMEISQINMEQSLYDPPAAQKKTKLEFEKSKIAYDQAYQAYLQRKIAAEANINSLRTNAGNAEKKLAEVQKLVALTTVRSPRAGIVSYYTDLSGIKREAGSSITSDDLIVAMVSDMNSLYSECKLNEDDLGKINVNQKVKILVKILDSKEFEGAVAGISGIPTLVNGKKFYAVSIRLNGDLSELRPQMTTFNEVEISSASNVLYVPKNAIVSENGRTFVFTKDLRKQQVVVGGSNSESISIQAGLKVGEEIYLNVPANPNRFKLSNI